MTSELSALGQAMLTFCKEFMTGAVTWIMNVLVEESDLALKAFRALIQLDDLCTKRHSSDRDVEYWENLVGLI
jgi:hypothetical protein